MVIRDRVRKYNRFDLRYIFATLIDAVAYTFMLIGMVAILLQIFN